MKVAIADYGPSVGRKAYYLGLLEQSIASAGHTILKHRIGTSPPAGTELAVFWGMKTAPVPRLREARLPFIVSEMNYFGPRGKTASIGWNYLGRKAIRPEPGTEPRPQPVLKPWIERNHGKIMVFGQVQRDYAVRNIDVDRWASQVSSEARSLWQREVVFRPHPNKLRNMGGTPFLGTEAALVHDNVWLGITHSSTSAVKCVAEGIPCIATSPESVAYDVCGHTVSERIQPDREAWAHMLSYWQWTPTEFCNGKALEWIMRSFEQARDDARKY